jgi:hypothetical protein
VNPGKLGKKLRREAVANPKKAAFLGLAALLAVYFWMPLVRGWIGKDEKNAVEVAAKPNAVQNSLSPTSAAATTESAAKETRPPWPQIIEWMHSDPRTMTAPPLTKTRDPFESPAVDVAATQAAEQPKPKLPAITPAAAGLALTSTIIGPQRRIAQINGRTYVVGQTIEGVKEKESLSAAFKLIEIHPRRAVLEAEGQRFELLIPEPGKSGKIDILGAVGSGQ